MRRLALGEPIPFDVVPAGTPTAVVSSPNLTGLTELDLRGAEVTARRVEGSAACPHLANLTRLDLSSCPVRDRGT